MRRALTLALVATLALAACGDDEGTVADEPGDADGPSGTPGPAGDGEALYEFAGTVLENDEHGPELCTGVMLESFPPQCGGVPTAGWSWDGVPGVQAEGGTTWAEVGVVGTWDGTAFTPAGAPTAPEPGGWRSGQEDAAEDAYAPVCEGAEVVDEARTSDADFIAATGAVEALPTVAATWVSDGGAPSAEWTLNVVVTEDAAGAEAAARPLWGGRLCVVERDQPPAAELYEAQERVPEVLGDDVEVFGSAPDTVAGHVTATVVLPTDEMQAALDAEFGEGVVRLVGLLRPAPA
jgi:hypothetical protein